MGLADIFFRFRKQEITGKRETVKSRETDLQSQLARFAALGLTPETTEEGGLKLFKPGGVELGERGRKQFLKGIKGKRGRFADITLQGEETKRPQRFGPVESVRLGLGT